MNGEIILVATLGIPLLLGLPFRVSASHIFFSLMAGELLGRYFGHYIEDYASESVANSNFAGYGEAFLILLPMVLTAVFLKGSISKHRAIINVPLLLITGIIFAAFVLPTLPQSLQDDVQSTIVGKWLIDLNEIIIGGMIVIQLVFLWVLSKKEKGHGKH